MHPTKRTVLAGGLFASLAATARAGTASKLGTESAVRNLKTYIGFGIKASGGAGDNDAGAWIESALAGLGFATERQTFEIPFFDPQTAKATCGETEAPLIPMLPVAVGTVEGPLAVFHALPIATSFPRGAIAALVLPHRRWSSAANPLIQSALKTCFDRGAAGVLLVTTGPTDEAIALNVSPDGPAYPVPVAMIGPRDFARLTKDAENPTVRMELRGKAGKRSAFNVIATKRGRGRHHVCVSTPRSGWGICAGERGPGIAVFLELARWLGTRDATVTMVCTSGHEFENKGGALFLHDRAPKPKDVSLWVHLGANLAARDWHETGRGLLPLPSADPQRILMASNAFMPIAERTFAGLPGLERPYELSPEAQGELKEIRSAGYERAIGAFGAHRYHHTRHDDDRCLNAALLPPVIDAYRNFITEILR